MKPTCKNCLFYHYESGKCRHPGSDFYEEVRPASCRCKRWETQTEYVYGRRLRHGSKG